MSEVVQFKPQPKEDDIGELISLYIETRDAKDALVRKQKAHVKKYTKVMDMIEAKLLTHLREHGGTSFSNDKGTAYISHKQFASIADAVSFKGFVIENRAWDMLDWKANVTAVQDYLSENQSLPPGVNLRSETSVNVMRK